MGISFEFFNLIKIHRLESNDWYQASFLAGVYFLYHVLYVCKFIYVYIHDCACSEI